MPWLETLYGAAGVSQPPTMGLQYPSLGAVSLPGFEQSRSP